MTDADGRSAHLAEIVSELTSVILSHQIVLSELAKRTALFPQQKNIVFGELDRAVAVTDKIIALLNELNDL